jgi:ADP-ribose pyrophosphatase
MPAIAHRLYHRTMTDAWVTTTRRVLFAGGPIAEVTVESVRLPNGDEITDYYQVRLPDYALVCALTPEDDVLLLRQYKHGVRRVCVGLPGGALEDREDPLAAAQRELMEETGFVSSEWQAFGGFVTNSNQRCSVAHLFVARGCRWIADPTATDIERPELIRMPLRELWSRVSLDDIGQVSHVALLLLATHQEHRHG